MKQTENYKDTLFYSMHAVEERSREVMLCSKNAKGTAFFLFKIGDNKYLFLTEQGYIATAIFNPFTCMYYVDDVYGITDIDCALTMLESYERYGE